MKKYCPKCQGEVHILNSDTFYVATGQNEVRYWSECTSCGRRSPDCRNVGLVMYGVLSTPRATIIGGDKLAGESLREQVIAPIEYRVPNLQVGQDQELELGTVEQVFENAGVSDRGKKQAKFRERAAGKLVLRVGEFVTVVDPAELRRILDLVDPPKLD